MRVDAGRHRHIADNGTEINTDQALSPAGVELIVGIIEQAGLTPSDVAAVQFVGEGRALLIVPFVVRGRLRHRRVCVTA